MILPAAVSMGCIVIGRTIPSHYRAGISLFPHIFDGVDAGGL
jgi:hypothetical protein